MSLEENNLESDFMNLSKEVNDLEINYDKEKMISIESNLAQLLIKVQESTGNLNASNVLNITELLTPFSATNADPQRRKSEALYKLF
jgi:hypothetical protein